ncbi:MAG: RNA polymerase sigma factor [Acidobacteriota bacterium]
MPELRARGAPSAPEASSGPTEAALVERARGGDEEAFALLVRAAAPIALAAARRITDDPALAEDAAQEAFLRAYRALPRYEQRSSFSGWVRTIAVHAAIDIVRRKRPESPMLDHPARDGGEKRQEDLDLLRRALAALSPVDREILLTRELEGLPDEAIARRLSMTVTGVRVRVHRARRRLRKRFQEERP